MKNTLRKIALEKRKTLNCKELSVKIVQKLITLQEYTEAKNIICYYPLKYEVNILECLNTKEKNWYLPRVNGCLLDICKCEKLSKGSFGIMEPQTQAVSDYNLFDMVIIPACAADINGYRLGYGKGYYDRFLPHLNKNCIKVVPLYSNLLFSNVFPKKYDIKADVIVTDKEILRI